MVQDLLCLKFLHDIAECGAAQKLGEHGKLAYESSPPVEVQLAERHLITINIVVVNFAWCWHIV